MAEEEEMKRRKEEMVNVFLKMKLNKEERNSGLNTSKLIDRYGYGTHSAFSRFRAHWASQNAL